MSGLTLKRQRFVDEYLVDGNSTQAAIRAGYSKQAASSIGYETLNDPQVSSAIAAKRAAETAQRDAQRAASRVTITIDVLSDMFIEDRLFAREVGQASAAVSATDKLARLHGFMVDRSLSMNVTTQMSDDDLMSLVRQLQAAPQLSADNNPPPLELTAVNSVDTPVLPRPKRPGRKPLKRKAIRKPKR